jgi:ABC-type uncharacterized transport system permease subunit
MQNTLILAAALLYAVCACCRRRGGADFRRHAWPPGCCTAPACGRTWRPPARLRIGFAIMLSAALWVSVAAYWLENRNFALDGLRRLVMPCAAVAACCRLSSPAACCSRASRRLRLAYRRRHPGLQHPDHRRLPRRADGAAGVAPARAHRPRRLAVRRAGPAAGLLTMEKLLFRLIGIGFVLLSLTVLSGIVFLRTAVRPGAALGPQDRLRAAVVAAVRRAAGGRRWRGWRGKTALRFTLAGFATLVLAYVGSRFVLEVVLHRVGRMSRIICSGWRWLAGDLFAARSAASCSSVSRRHQQTGRSRARAFRTRPRR